MGEVDRVIRVVRVTRVTRVITDVGEVGSGTTRGITNEYMPTQEHNT